MTKFVRAVAAAALTSAVSAAHAGWFSKDSITEPFLQPDQINAVSLSPDGKHLAMLVEVTEYDARHKGLMMVDTESGERHLALQSTALWVDSNHFRYQDPISVDWMNNDRMAVNFNDGTARQLGVDGTTTGELCAHFIGMIKPDGRTDLEALVRLYKNANDLGIVAIAQNAAKPLVLKLDDKRISGWLTDSTGLLRVLQTLETAKGSDVTRVATWYRENEAAPWRKVIDQSLTDDRITPIQVGEQAGLIVVQARNGGDRLAMWNYDVVNQAFVDLAAGHPLEDIVNVDIEAGTREFKSVSTDGLKPQTVWFDARMAQLQASVDAALPGHLNILQGSASSQVLVVSRSDVDPGRILVLDSRTMKMREIAVVRPGTDPARMQAMRTLRYPSFDGLAIPAYLTLPGKPAGPSPLVVLIHGGPQSRDHWEWNQEVQIFAAHGYAVFQPQFRGSQGFGKHFEEAGYGQWGQAMQDDITAGVRYLIDKKIADPARICIVGASYGGYAALWGLVKNPELYKCGVSQAGVSDLESQFLIDSDFAKSAIQREFVRSRVGDPALMKATFDSVSPLNHADRIVAPLLLVHGTLDERVPPSQGRKMYDRMRALHKDVKWLEFDDEAHSLWHINNQRDYYDAVFDLLERTIGKGTPPQASGVAAH